MDFLKGVISDELYAQLETELKGKEVKLANLASGDYIGKEKYEALEIKLNNATEQLGAANAKLEGFDPNWKDTVAEAEKKAADKVQQVMFDKALDVSLLSAKAKDIKAVRAMLDLDKIKYDDGKLSGLEEQLESLKESKGWAFGNPDDGVPTGTGMGGADKPGATVTKEQFSKMSYLDKVKLKTEQPDQYKELIGGNE